ncbi:MAG: ABC transporter ATP-binding protein [Eubacteriales bacterium]|nr:ABC transporter ATP-binding protein [Eubacteriales bacterium]
MKNHDQELLLNIENLHIHFVLKKETVKALNGVDIKVARGKTIGLVGETGAGKTTTALAIMNMIQKPQGRIIDGKITLDGIDILSKNRMEIESIRGNLVSMIFQDPMSSLNPVLNVGEQIAEGLVLHKHMDRKEALVEAGELLEKIGIPRSRACDYPHQFSGGMRQRVLIAMGLACNPKLLIADEPTTALDVTIQAQVLQLMRELKANFNTTIFMITHDFGIVAEMCDEVYVMYAGTVIERGTLTDIFDHTRHPYTEGLFNSLPDIEHRNRELIPIHGRTVDPTNLPAGCPFWPRCNYICDKCRQDMPPEILVSDTHGVKCWLYENTSENPLMRRDYVAEENND